MKLLSQRLVSMVVIAVALLAPVHVQFDGTPFQKYATQELNTLGQKQNLTINQMQVVHVEVGIAHAQQTPDTCSFGDLGCYFVNLLELILVNTTMFFAGIAGFVLDFFLEFSINSASYRDTGFIEQGWEIIRDFTNIIFIFALLLTAFKMVVGTQGGNTKKTLIKTILVALTINFSLFFVYLIVDSSNLLAYTFYNKIEAPEISFNPRGGGITSSSGGNSGNPDAAGNSTEFDLNGTAIEGRKAPSISLALLQKVNPQKLLDELKGEKDAERMILIFIVGAINIAFMFLFLSVSLLFLGRTLGLMILGITAPFAMASLALGSKAANLSYVGWNKWFPQVISLSFMAPVFVFMLYLTTLFSKITDNLVIDNAAGVINTVFKIALPMLVIFTLVQLSKRMANKMAGEIGGFINGYVQKAAGAGLGIAALAVTGGVAAGAGALGKGASMFGAKNFAEKARNVAKVAASTKFDVSKIPGFSAFAGKDGSKVMSSLSGKSLREQYQDKQKEFREKGVYSNDTAKLDKRYEERKKKDADDSADEARKKAEAKHEAELYEAKMKEMTAKQTEQYKAVDRRLQEANAALKQLLAEERRLKGIMSDKSRSDTEKDAAKAELETLRNKQALQEEKKKSAQTELKDMGIPELEKRVKDVEDKKKDDGDRAENQSRQASASQVIGTDPALANAILNKKKAKGKQVDIEKFEKYVKDLDKDS